MSKLVNGFTEVDGFVTFFEELTFMAFDEIVFV
jgi:hypothetical protein